MNHDNKNKKSLKRYDKKILLVFRNVGFRYLTKKSRLEWLTKWTSGKKIKICVNN